MRRLTWEDVRARRVARSSLAEPAASQRLVDVVGAVGGIHAQVTAAAELSLSARVAGLTQQDVRDELWKRRRLVKTWTLRGTLHLHPADELPLWTAARRAVVGARDEQDGTSPAQRKAVVEAIADALDGRCLLREELADEVVRRVGSWPRKRLLSGWGFFLGDAATAGLLCHGPPVGAKVTFVRPDQWLGGWRDVDPTDALAEVARRFLKAYGPATHREFRQWFTARSFTPAEARRLFESLRDELEQVEVDGRRAWLLAADADLAERPVARSLRLLPEYDCYVMGFREREHLVPAAARARLFDHGRGRFEGPAAVSWVLLDGAVAGMWSRRRRGRRVDVHVELFDGLGAERREELEQEAARVGRFLGAEADLSLAPAG